jgi:MFS superfamily sulfate permease-like transporter
VFAPDIEHALFVGIGLSLVLYLRKVTRPHVAVIARHPDGDLRDAAVHGLRECRHIAALRFDARLFFGNSAFLEEAVLEHVASRPDVRCVLLDCGGVNSLDATGEHALSTLLDRLREGGSDMHFVRVRSSIVEMLTRTGFAGRAGADHFHARYEDALEAIWAQLGCDHRDQCPLAVPTKAGAAEEP